VDRDLSAVCVCSLSGKGWKDSAAYFSDGPAMTFLMNSVNTGISINE